MLYAFTNDRKEILKFPIFPTEVRAMFPDVSFPPDPWDFTDLTYLNIYNVHPTSTADMPVPDEGMKIKLVGAEWNEEAGKFVRLYTQVPATPVDAG